MRLHMSQVLAQRPWSNASPKWPISSTRLHRSRSSQYSTCSLKYCSVLTPYQLQAYEYNSMITILMNVLNMAFRGMTFEDCHCEDLCVFLQAVK